EHHPDERGGALAGFVGIAVRGDFPGATEVGNDAAGPVKVCLVGDEAEGDAERQVGATKGRPCAPLDQVGGEPGVPERVEPDIRLRQVARLGDDCRSRHSAIPMRWSLMKLVVPAASTGIPATTSTSSPRAIPARPSIVSSTMRKMSSEEVATLVRMGMTERARESRRTTVSLGLRA